jgi:hypothetical protein
MEKQPENKKPKTTGKNAVKANVKAKIKKGAKKSLTPQEKKEGFKQYNRERLKNIMEYRKERFGGPPYGDYSRLSRYHAKQFKALTGAHFRDPAADPTFATRDKSALEYNKQILALHKEDSELNSKLQEELNNAKLEGKRLKLADKRANRALKVSIQKEDNLVTEEALKAAYEVKQRELEEQNRHLRAREEAKQKHKEAKFDLESKRKLTEEELTNKAKQDEIERRAKEIQTLKRQAEINYERERTMANLHFQEKEIAIAEARGKNAIREMEEMNKLELEIQKGGDKNTINAYYAQHAQQLDALHQNKKVAERQKSEDEMRKLNARILAAQPAEQSQPQQPKWETPTKRSPQKHQGGFDYEQEQQTPRYNFLMNEIGGIHKRIVAAEAQALNYAQGTELKQLTAELRDLQTKQRKEEEEKEKRLALIDLGIQAQARLISQNREDHERTLKNTKEDTAKELQEIRDISDREFRALRAENNIRDGQLGEHEQKISALNGLVGGHEQTLAEHGAGIASLNEGMHGIYDRADQLLDHQHQQDQIIDEGGVRVDRVVFERRYGYGRADRRDDQQVRAEDQFGQIAAGLDGQNPLPVQGPGFPQPLGYQRPPRVEEVPGQQIGDQYGDIIFGPNGFRQ